MKKIGLLLLAVILISTIFVSGFQSKGDVEPNTVYEVYLDDEVIGRVRSKDALEKYIDHIHVVDGKPVKVIDSICDEILENKVCMK